MENLNFYYRAFAILAFIFMTGKFAVAEPEKNNDLEVIANFSSPDVADNWKTVNDNVMGGRSKGGPAFSEGLLTFSGTTNTNGGGFSSIRTKSTQIDLSNQSGILLRVKGDGRTYKAEMRTNVSIGSWSVPFRSDFKTQKDQWKEIYLPFESFTPTMFGRKLSNPPAFDTNKISSIGFMIYDKKDGPFQLQVEWVKTVNKKSNIQAKTTSSNIVDMVLNDDRFNTLKTALSKADLASVLQGEGPFTVFAPTDKAFAKLPEGTVETLIKPENKQKLIAILKYHVISGRIELAQALETGNAKTLQGANVSIGFEEGRVLVNNAAIQNANVQTSNGIIHVIDSVLLPPQPKNDIPAVAERAGMFNTLLAAVSEAGLEEAISAEGPFTILAPTDEAFKALPENTLNNLLKKENRDQLKAILTYHVISGKITAGDALNAQNAKTLNGNSVQFKLENGTFKVNNATIRKININADNGIIHVIDKVLIPKTQPEKIKSRKSIAISTMHPSKLIENAIEQGVPVFNNENHKKCADIYKECVTTLSNHEAIDSKTQTALKKLITYTEKKDSATDRAWLYRSGLNHVYQTVNIDNH